MSSEKGKPIKVVVFSKKDHIIYTYINIGLRENDIMLCVMLSILTPTQ